MKRIIICGCKNKIIFIVKQKEIKKVICNICGAIFISSNKGYIYTRF